MNEMEGLECLELNPTEHIWDESKRQHAPGWVPTSSEKLSRRVEILVSASGKPDLEREVQGSINLLISVLVLVIL